MGIFDNKVVVITGAGRGIGRAHALAFAKEGAKVVVNDLGTEIDGSGSSLAIADSVVKEILFSEGEAVANYDSVVTMNGARTIINTALNNFGRIDVLINNAGILRDKTLLKMDETMWDTVIAVHLKGTFACTQAAAREMRNQGDGGSIINTTSITGLLGNFGQSNYGAAKAGIVGFTRIAAIELEKYGINVNAIAPAAMTRMVSPIVSENMIPECISPLVLFLASERGRAITGRVFGIHGSKIFEYKITYTDGIEKENHELWTLDEIAEKFNQIGV